MKCPPGSSCSGSHRAVTPWYRVPGAHSHRSPIPSTPLSVPAMAGPPCCCTAPVTILPAMQHLPGPAMAFGTWVLTRASHHHLGAHFSWSGFPQIAAWMDFALLHPRLGKPGPCGTRGSCQETWSSGVQMLLVFEPAQVWRVWQQPKLLATARTGTWTWESSRAPRAGAASLVQASPPFPTPLPLRGQ